MAKRNWLSPCVRCDKLLEPEKGYLCDKCRIISGNKKRRRIPNSNTLAAAKRKKRKSELYGGNWKAIRKYVLEREKQCRMCGSMKDLTVDHVHNVSLKEFSPKEAYEQGLAVTLCRSCNSRKQ